MISIPFYLSNFKVSFLSAYFESISGLTGTGFSIFKNIKYLDPTLILWRSSTQWIGGLYFLLFLILLFSNKTFLMMFWIHFISINLFTGGWIVRDSQKLAINKILIIVPLLITYLVGPLGIFIYWLIRIFHAKSISLYD